MIVIIQMNLLFMGRKYLNNPNAKVSYNQMIWICLLMEIFLMNNDAYNVFFYMNDDNPVFAPMIVIENILVLNNALISDLN